MKNLNIMEAALQVKKELHPGLAHELSLIQATDEIIARYKASNEDGDDLMVRQYEHLRKKIVANLLEYLREYYRLPFQLAEAA